jgi:hypothetical protein
MTQNERERMARGDSIESEVDISVTDAAASDLDYHLISPWGRNGKFPDPQGSFGSYQLETVGMVDGRHPGLLVVRGSKRTIYQR